MTEDERAAFAARLDLELRERFLGVAQRAYRAAGVNAATWKRAVTGLTIKPHKQIEIVVNHWPETRGDWTKIPAEPVLDMGEQMRAVIERNRQLEQENEQLRRASGETV